MRHRNCGEHPEIRDYGCEPFIFNIHHATNMNENFRTTLWTGRDMQLTLMSIPVHGDIGVEIVMDGRILGDNLSRAGKDEKWLWEQLKLQGYKDSKEIFLALYRPEEDKLTLYPND